MQSRPENKAGRACRCTGVGATYPSSSILQSMWSGTWVPQIRRRVTSSLSEPGSTVTEEELRTAGKGVKFETKELNEKILVFGLGFRD